MPNNRITTIVGAGGTIDIGGFTTEKMTNLLVEYDFHYCDVTNIPGVDRRTDIVKYIYDRLASGGYPVNFETIYHVLEKMHSYYWGWQNRAAKKMIPPYAYLILPLYTSEYNDSSLLVQISNKYIDIIAEAVMSYCAQYNVEMLAKSKWHHDFWNNYKGRMDVVTFNYDDVIEQSIGDYEDGFDDIAGYPDFKQFVPKKLWYSQDKTTICHQHGSVHFGDSAFSTADINKDVFKYLFEDLYRWNDASKVPHYGKSHPHTQAGEQMLCDRIITGLDKLEHLNRQPYDTYHAYLNKCMMENNRLLIIGYSFGDLYVNQLIERMELLHGANKKVVIIDWWGKNDYEQMVHAQDLSNEACASIQRLMSEERAMEDIVRGRANIDDSFVSGNGQCMIYTHGLQNAVAKHGGEIQNFLA